MVFYAEHLTKYKVISPKQNGHQHSVRSFGKAEKREESYRKNKSFGKDGRQGDEEEIPVLQSQHHNYPQPDKRSYQPNHT